MLVNVKSKYSLKKINKGLGGIILKEIPVEEYLKDLSIYEVASKYEDEFDITNWAFFMVFDDETPIGAVTIVSKTENVRMLDGRDDMSVLWDIRVDDKYKHQGVGTALFNMAVKWSQQKGLKQMKIECQNNNVVACKLQSQHMYFFFTNFECIVTFTSLSYSHGHFNVKQTIHSEIVK